MNKISISSISISYSKPIIENLSFSLESRDILLIEGRNGIGKTSILKSIAGIIKPTRGTITVNNKNIFEVSNQERKKLVSLAQQSASYFTPIKVIEFLETAITSNSMIENWKRIKKFIEILEIENILSKPINTLSEGQKKLALVCRTLIQGSIVTLLDEPEAFLDIHNQSLLIKAIEELVKEDKIVIIVSHNESFYSKICNKKLSILNKNTFQFYEKLELSKI
ncbi:MAG: ATP-binding cassette domain-containing protein [Brevinematia bacterium]|jgi:ABC-type cobalamin/Fe3+-siderophores transport system ATPase subunit